MPGAGEETELGSAEAPPARDQDVALVHVLAARTDVRPGRRPVQQPDELVPIDDRVLDRHDGVGAAGDRCARRDAHRLAGADGPLGLVADERATDDLQLAGLRGCRSGDVGRADGEPVHRRGSELGKIVRREDVFGDHRAVRVGQRQTER